MSRAWDAACNAAFLEKVQSIVQEWDAGEIDDREAIKEVAYAVEVYG